MPVEDASRSGDDVREVCCTVGALYYYASRPPGHDGAAVALAADDEGGLVSPDGEGSVDASGFAWDWESAVVECGVDEMVGGLWVDAHVV